LSQAGKEKKMKPSKTRKSEKDGKGKRKNRLYTVEVLLVSGPLSEEYDGQEISRTIQIRGDQTLEDLHHAIFEAFDREDEHMYEFQFGEGPDDPAGPRYVLPEEREDGPLEANPSIAGTVDETTLDALKLEVDDVFGYWFDFGDDWMHEVQVVAIEDAPAKGKFPKIVKRVGDSPPQYPDESADWDEDEESGKDDEPRPLDEELERLDDDSDKDEDTFDE
jgi:hypothetical protein